MTDGSNRRKLKLAFLGGGIDSAIGRVHRIAIETDQRFELVAGCFSRDADINIASAADYRVETNRIHSSFGELLNRESSSIDALVILTPIAQHSSQVLECVASGVPVICEKALVDTSKDAQAIKAALVERNGFLAVAYNYTAYPMFRELRALIAAGVFGRIDQIQIEMPQEGFARLGADGKPVIPQDWRLLDATIPTVSLDLGVHLHGMVGFLTGEKPVELVATQNSYGHFSQIIDNVHCVARYSGDMQVSAWYGKTALGYRNGLRVRVFGKAGAAEWHQENPEALHLADTRGRKSILDRGSTEATVANLPRYTRFKAGHPAGFIEAFANYYYDIADALHVYLHDRSVRLKPFVLGIDEALEGLYMLEAIVASSASKSWVKVKQ